MNDGTWIERLWRKILPRRSETSERTSTTSKEVEGVRSAFKVRYHNFKLLLAANNEALEAMSGLEEYLRGVKPFGMHTLRASITRILTLCYRTIRHLKELTPGRHVALMERFEIIRSRLEQELGAARAQGEREFILPIERVGREQADQTGPKMANLGELASALGLGVPPGFVITAAAHDLFMGSAQESLDQNTLAQEIDRRIQLAGEGPQSQLALASEIQNLIINSALPDKLAQTILEAQNRLAMTFSASTGENSPRMILRSSSLGEDLPGASFAGQYRSKVNVGLEFLLDSYKEIVASVYSLEAMSYRRRKGLADEDAVMCVGVQLMVDAVAGGVVYSHDPLGIRGDVAVVYSVFGLPKQVVDGTDQADFFSFAREDLKLNEREIAHKQWKSLGSTGEGVRRVPVDPEDADRPSLDDEQARQVARMALAIERHFGEPQDVEWALDAKGEIHVLQARPLLLVSQPRVRLADLELPDQYAGRGEEGAGPWMSHRVSLGHGVTASPGVAAGEIFVAKREADILAMPKGAVLVVSQPLPRWAVILPDAAAIVAEEGSTAGHLASVAREFGKPALFSVIDATKRLKPGSIVTVDADGMTLYQGRVESLLDREQIAAPLMEGTPVHKLLTRLARHIVPLHLLDPDADTFTAANCETLHDILRFCHEKAVQSMFHFGRDNPFPERSGKQLVCHVPMQFWVIDLEDGFKEPVTGKRVNISNIQSRPMLALWRGMNAVPWEGPPAPRAKGLLSIFHEATINTGLDVALPTPYLNQNYFMISRDFVSQQSRFGFHFSTVEALVSARQRENYLNFQFKGGAASQDRRIARAHLIAGLLESLGFTVRILLDSLSARMENRPADYLETRLVAVGYLTMHTRQLDVVMEPGGHIEGWRQRLSADLERILSGELGGESSLTDCKRH